MNNRYGVDVGYFKQELKRLRDSLGNRTPGKLKRYLWRLADVAASQENVELETHRTTSQGVPAKE